MCPPPYLYPHHELVCPLPLKKLPLLFLPFLQGGGWEGKVEKEGKWEEKIWEWH